MGVHGGLWERFIPSDHVRGPVIANRVRREHSFEARACRLLDVALAARAQRPADIF